MKKLVLALLCGLSAHVLADVPELIGGTPVEPKSDYNAVVYSSMGNSRCSSTVVGPRTLFIAAHCVSDGGTATFKTQDGTQYSGKCTHAPQYEHAAWERLQKVLLEANPKMVDLFTANSTADWALCKLNKEVTGITYETVETREAPLKVGDTPLLCGYGCTSPGGGGGNDGTLRIGRATVTGLPSGNNNDVVTKGKAALCFGDSGGPFFCTVGASNTNRTLCGINSRGNISDTSYLSAVFTPMAKAFIQDWKQKNGEKICGYDKDLKGCRGAAPQGPSKFTVESNDVVLSVTMEADAVFTPEEAKSQLQSAIDVLGDK